MSRVAIGFRAEKKLVNLAIVSTDDHGGNETLVTEEKLVLQMDCDPAEALSILRKRLITLFDLHSPSSIGVRLADKPQRTAHLQSMFSRARVEGVILEAAFSSGIKKIIAGPASTIKSGMKTRTPIRDYLKLDEIRGIDVSGKKKPEFREAVIAALSALPEGK